MLVGLLGALTTLLGAHLGGKTPIAPVPEEIDRLVQGLQKVNTTPGMGRAREDPSDGGRRG